MPKKKKVDGRHVRFPGESFGVSPEAGQTLPAEWSPTAYADWLLKFLQANLANLTKPQLKALKVDIDTFIQSELIEHPVESPETLQAHGREGLTLLKKGRWFKLEAGIIWGIIRSSRQVVRGGRIGSHADLFRAAMMDAIAPVWSQLRTCPHCGHTFRKHGKRKYCSAECSRRAIWKRFEATRPPRDYHAEHERRVRKRLKPGARVVVKRRTKG